MEVEHHLPLPVLHADSSVMDERHLRAVGLLEQLEGML